MSRESYQVATLMMMMMMMIVAFEPIMMKIIKLTSNAHDYFSFWYND